MTFVCTQIPENVLFQYVDEDEVKREAMEALFTNSFKQVHDFLQNGRPTCNLTPFTLVVRNEERASLWGSEAHRTPLWLSSTTRAFSHCCLPNR